ncbi:MAG TPA: hypothetical protein VHE83_08420 [Mycobacteriales bacterium]|nr:hypothetical protein [Mycobacteriales bacterium]
MGFLAWLRLQWDRVGAWVCIVAGAVVLLVGYIGVSGTPYTSEQLPYIVSGGLTGIFLLGVGGMLWLSADLRDEWRKLDDLDRTLLTHKLVPITETSVSAPVDDATGPLAPVRSGRARGRA